MKPLDRPRMMMLAASAALAYASTIPVGGPKPASGPRVAGIDLSAYSAEGPSSKTDLLFIHHSCGAQWLAAAGCENNGELRARLQAGGYVVHEASYGSAIGEHTDLFDWLPKFRDHMSDVLKVDQGDRSYNDARTNRVVVFKSCFPNSDFVGIGEAPGNPAGPELTVENAKATMTAVLEELRKRPDVLFVYVTAPPLVGDGPVPVYRDLARAAKRVFGHGGKKLPPDASGALARAFNDWMKSPNGWLRGYERTNVVVFDYFDILTGEGKQNVAAYPSRAEDSHPSSEGNHKATNAFVPMLNRSLHRLELASIIAAP